MSVRILHPKILEFDGVKFKYSNFRGVKFKFWNVSIKSKYPKTSESKI